MTQPLQVPTVTYRVVSKTLMNGSTYYCVEMQINNGDWLGVSNSYVALQDAMNSANQLRSQIVNTAAIVY